MRSLYRISFTAALLLLSGCSEHFPYFERLIENTEFRLDGSSIDVNRWEVVRSFPEEGGMILSARSVAFTCTDGNHDDTQLEKAFRADIHIADPAALPLGTPIDVGDPSAPIQAELSALDFEGDCLFWKGSAKGTVRIDTFNLNGSSKFDVGGTFDLRAENAVSDCAEIEPRLIEMSWTNFDFEDAQFCK